MNKEEIRNVSPVTCCFVHMMPADTITCVPHLLTHGERLLGQLRNSPMDIVSNIHLRMGLVWWVYAELYSRNSGSQSSIVYCTVNEDEAAPESQECNRKWKTPTFRRAYTTSWRVCANPPPLISSNLSKGPHFTFRIQATLILIIVLSFLPFQVISLLFLFNTKS